MKKAIFIFGVMVMLPVLAAAQSPGHFSSGFETGVIYDVWKNSGNKTVEAVKVQDGVEPREGSYMAHFVLDRSRGENSYRTEILPEAPEEHTLAWNTDLWIGFSIYLKEWDYDTSADYCFQIHDNLDNWNTQIGREPLSIGTSKGNWLIRGEMKDNNTVYWSGYPYKTGVWVDWVINCRFSPDDDGYIRIWKDGIKVVDVEGPNADKYKRAPYFKCGIYKWDWKNRETMTSRRESFYDSCRIGNGADGYAQGYAGVAPEGSVQKRFAKLPSRPPALPPAPAEDSGASKADLADIPEDIPEMDVILDEGFDKDPGFQVVTGGWEVKDGRYVLSSTENQMPLGNISLCGKNLKNEFIIESTCMVTDTSNWDDFAVIFGYQDQDNYYFVSFNEQNDENTNGILLHKDGETKELFDFSEPTKAGKDHEIKISYIDGTIIVEKNGELAGAVKDSTFTNGKIGYGSRNNVCEFDNLLVKEASNR